MICSSCGHVGTDGSGTCAQCGASQQERPAPHSLGEGFISPRSVDQERAGVGHGRADMAWPVFFAWMLVFACANAALMWWAHFTPGWPEAIGHAVGCAILVGAIIGIATYCGVRLPRTWGLVLTAVFIAIPLLRIATSHSMMERTEARGALLASLDARRQAILAAFDEKAKVTNEETANLHIDDVLKPKNLVDRAAIAHSREVVIQYRQVRDQAERDAVAFYADYERMYDSVSGPDGERIRAQLSAKKKTFLGARGDLSRAVDHVLRIVEQILDLADHNAGSSYVSNDWVWFADPLSAQRFRDLMDQLSIAHQEELDALSYIKALQQDEFRATDSQGRRSE